MKTAVTGKDPMKEAAGCAGKRRLQEAADRAQEGPENGRSTGEQRAGETERVRTAPEQPRTARADQGTERGRHQAARLFVPGTAALRTAIKAAREEIREEAEAEVSRWIGERRFSSLWEA